MKVVFIYGPPAAGEYTVALELEKLTGFTLFHNHMSIDWARPFFKFGTSEFWRLAEQLRRTVIEEAARADLSLILTFVHLPSDDLAVLRHVCALLEENGSQACFVNLVCAPDVLRKRVTAMSRVEMGKLCSLAALERQLEVFDYFARIAGVESLVIDNSDWRRERLRAGSRATTA